MSNLESTPAAPRQMGVQAFETGLQVLSAFVGTEPMPMLKTLAQRLAMHPAKVHRYLVSLCRMGYVEQDRGSSRYRLSGAALRLGVAAIASVDVLRVARPVLPGICASLQQTILLATWSESGAVIAMRESPPGPLTVSASVNSILPLLQSSTGRVFGAWLPRERTGALLRDELERIGTAPRAGCPSTMEEADVLFDDVLRRGLARVTGQLSPLVHALSAPVFDGHGELAAVLTAGGAAGNIDVTWSGPVARGLADAAAQLSHGLGHEPFPSQKETA